MSGQKLCPTGWHVPNDTDWETLITFLGGNNVAGGKLKQTGTDLWNGPNTGATNESGFNAIPGGVRSGTPVILQASAPPATGGVLQFKVPIMLLPLG